MNKKLKTTGKESVYEAKKTKKNTSKHHRGVWNTKSAVRQTDYLRVTPQAQNKEVHCMSFSRRIQPWRLWWHNQLSLGTGEACRATTGHATANYPSETWRESLSCVKHTHTLRAQINPIPSPRLWWRRLFNESREVFKASCAFRSPSSISFESKISICTPAQSMAKAYLDWPGWFRRSFVWLFRFEHFDARTHFIASLVCPATPTPDLISAKEYRSDQLQSPVMAPVLGLRHVIGPTLSRSNLPNTPSDWGATLALISVALSDATSFKTRRYEWWMIMLQRGGCGFLLLSKGKSSTFKPGRYIYIVLCVCDSYFLDPSCKTFMLI